MSNTLAISTVTAAFSRRLLGAATKNVNSAKVRVGPPVAKLSDDGKPVVNLHLFRVEPNTAHTASHLPTRRGDGGQIAPTQLPLNLYYVVSFYGSHDTFEPDIMLGDVMLSLEAFPALSKATLRGALNDHEVLEDSDLADDLTRLRVTRQLSSIDEFSKIWSIFYQVPYVISLIYEVRHVMLEEDIAPVPSLPVTTVQNWVAPMSKLRLDSADAGQGALPVVGGTLQIRGAGLAVPGLMLEADGAPLSGFSQAPDVISLPLTPANFGGTAPKAGLHRLQAITPLSAGQPAHLATRSNAIAFGLHPTVTLGALEAPAGGETASGTLKITFTPAIGSEQTVRLLLDARDAANPAHVVLPGRAPVQDEPDANELTFAFSDLARGSYLVRADVDGMISPVVLDENSREITGPEVTL